MEARELDFAQAINEALRQEMLRDETIIVLGEDVGVFGGVFGCTKGLLQEFGEERVRDTPISESAIIGTAIGAAISGALGGLFAAKFGFNILFIVVAVFALASAFLPFLIYKDIEPRDHPTPRAPKTKAFQVPFLPKG